MRTQEAQPKAAISFRIRMGAADFSVTSIEPSATKRFDLRGTTRHEQKQVGQIIASALGLSLERRHTRRIAAYHAALDRAGTPASRPLHLSQNPTRKYRHRRPHHSHMQQAA